MFSCNMLNTTNMGILSTILTLTLCITVTTAKGPLRVYRPGYHKHNLPRDGGWTHWFNLNYPWGGGDIESIYDVTRTYGRGCRGMPCKRPVAMKVISTNGKKPKEEGNVVNVNPIRGIECMDKYQPQGTTCADYMVRFYCPELRIKCRKRLNKWASKRKKYQNKDTTKWNSVVKEVPLEFLS